MGEVGDIHLLALSKFNQKLIFEIIIWRIEAHKNPPPLNKDFKSFYHKTENIFFKK